MVETWTAAVPEGAERDGCPAALARLDALVETATALAAEVDASDVWPAGHRRRVLSGLDRVAGLLATVRAAVLTAEQRSQAAVGVGDRDFLAARARAARTGLGEARREVRQAQTLAAMPPVAAAVRSGHVPLAHVDALGRVAEGAGEQARAALARAGTQEHLARLAERTSLREFTTAAERLVASFDPAGVEQSAAVQRRARFFVMSRQADGTYLKGRLDHVSAEVVRTAIAAVAIAPDEERTKAQADADALVAVAERAVAGMAGVRARRPSSTGTLLPDLEQDAADARVSGVAGRPSLSILVPAETFAELQRVQRARVTGAAAGAAVGADAGGTDAGGTDAGGAVGAVDAVDAGGADVGGADAGGTADSGVTGLGDGNDGVAWRSVEPATLEDGTPVPMSELARLLCDSEVGRIVLSAEGVPLDLGRTQRLYTGQQRRAVIVRDRCCAWNGCDVPAAFCEVHHMRWWDRDDGPTSVENGVLLCSHHHHVVHQHDLDILRLNRPPSGGPVLGEPYRYLFRRRRDGRVVNTPAGHAPAAREPAEHLPVAREPAMGSPPGHRPAAHVA